MSFNSITSAASVHTFQACGDSSHIDVLQGVALSKTTAVDAVLDQCAKKARLRLCGSI